MSLHPTKPNMRPLQLISIFSFIFLLLSKVFSTAPNAKLGCPDRCGGIPIPYPFGVGPSCSLKPSFNINCNTSTDPPKPYLSIFNGEVVEINRTYIRVKYPNLISACYDYRGTGIDVKQSMRVDLSGTPYMLSSFNRVTAIGCDDMVLPSNGSFADGGCSAFCADTKDVGGGDLGYCPFNATLLGNGCCEAQITRDTSFLGAQLIDLSGGLQRKKLFPCSYAFIQERRDTNESVFSYPLYYLHNSTALLNDKWASTTRPPVVRLEWNIGDENCTEAKRNSTAYACQDENSVCVDVGSGRGYMCGCMQGYEGNPYLLGGCQAISVSSSIAKLGCEDGCGKFSIPFPFGMGQNHCYLEPSFEVICNASTNPPTPYLRILDKEIIELNATRVRVKYPNLGTSCNNSKSGITLIEKQSLIIDLSSTQYTMSEENWITAIGCNDMVVVKARRANRSFIGSSCATICSDIYSVYDGYCPYGDTMYGPGDGCCRAPIPKGTSYLEANLTDLSGRWTRANISCSYTFVDYKTQYRSFYRSMDNSTVNPLDGGTLYSRLQILALEWRIGTLSCKEARQNQTTFVCQSNSKCVDFDAKIQGYLCNCSEGYKGNPYLSPGCEDIDECTEYTNFPCDSNSNCINTPGSFHCSCLEGYAGDGRKDGKGCTKLPPSKSKMIILIGIGSGLGFLLFILMCFWLYKMLKKRKEKTLKEKFFKRNGGLLLQQQTNEGTIGKIKVFPALELEVATDHFNASRILGQGGQGTVYKGMLTDGKIVAVKKSKLVEENQLEQFINEVVILSQINHRNVVRLLGCCLETEVPLLVYEFMPNGTLYDLIHDPNIEFPFPWNMRLKIAADIAGALSYLHSASSMPIYHRDIKSSNILLDEKYVVKVSDFGTSRSIATDQTHLTTLVKGTFGYLDPEYFQSSQFTEKSDVYSFGVVLVELLTGQRPISFDKTEEERGLATRFLRCMEEECLETILDPLVLEESKKEEVILVARLAQRCLNLKGRMRPNMKEVATELESYRMSQICSGVRDETEDAVRDFEDIVTTISDSDYTWTDSYKSAAASSSDTHPLMFSKD